MGKVTNSGRDEKRKPRVLSLLFHRRLALLSGCVVVVSCLFGVQLARLTLVQGSERRAQAMSRLDRISYLDTVRGMIVDRNGVELAVDRSSYDIAVDFSVISGEWVRLQSRLAARDQMGRTTWNEISPAERTSSAIPFQPGFQNQVNQLWDIVAARGGIERSELDERVAGIRDRISRMAEAVWERQKQDALERFGSEHGDDASVFEARPILEQTIAHPVLFRVPEEVAFDFKRLAEQLPGLHVIDSRKREYPQMTMTVTLDRDHLPAPLRDPSPVTVLVQGVADHILGSMRDNVYKSDVQHRPFRTSSDADGGVDLGGYLPGDSVGARGVEAGFESFLRGDRGVIHKHLNTGEEDRIDPVPGDTIALTVDIFLQARIQAILAPEFGLTQVQQFHSGWEAATGEPIPAKLPLGWPLNAAAVVLDVDTGEILAMVSTPTLATIETWPEWRRDASAFVNRPVEGAYPPGSIIKPIVLVSAVTEGVHDLDTHIDCTGYFFESNPNVARCWIYRPAYDMGTHTRRFGHALDAPTAIGASCNIYFYTLAAQLGGERLLDWYRRFGMGSTLDIGLMYDVESSDKHGKEVRRRYGENGGSMPSAQTLDVLRSEGQLAFEEIAMGIGQGKLLWTPLHAANAYATLARGGYVRDASIVVDDPRTDRAARSGSLELDDRAVSEALEGLRQSVMESYGTGHALRYASDMHPRQEPIINASNVTVWAKTGTAQAPDMKIARQSSSRDTIVTDLIEGIDHAWFVGLVGSGDAAHARPRYAIAVMVEYGGSGGRVAGPIANQIILALQQHGYLHPGLDQERSQP
ncbi:MAG: peptidoglycan D,D-transpeptidase FtsI family protein [Phycisphaerales bacterium]